MRKELLTFVSAIGFISAMKVVKPVEALGFEIHNQYPACGEAFNLPGNHTAWVVDVTENSVRKEVAYDLGPLPGQCTNPDGNNNVIVSVTLNRSLQTGEIYTPWDIKLSCFPGATGFSIQPVVPEPKTHGFNAVTGGLHPDNPVFTNNLRIKSNLPDGDYKDTDILFCNTGYGTKVPVRRINHEIKLRY